MCVERSIRFTGVLEVLCLILVTLDFATEKINLAPEEVKIE